MNAEMSAGRRIEPGVSVVDELGPLAEQAVQAIQALIHQTRPAVGALNQPAQAAQLLAVLAELTGILPQLLDHLQCWLLDQQRRGRLRTDHDCPPPQDAGDQDAGDQDARPDPGSTVRATVVALSRAGACLHQGGHVLEAAHQHAAHLLVADVLDVTGDVLELARSEAGWGQR